MRKIHKYRVAGAATILLPVGAVVRHFAVQDEIPTIWVEFDTEIVTRQNREFTIIRTGSTIPARGRYVSTCMDDEFVWHLYEIT